MRGQCAGFGLTRTRSRPILNWKKAGTYDNVFFIRTKNLAAMNNIIGTEDDDNLSGSAAVDLIVGGSGNDTIFGADQYDAIDGGPGDDFIVGDFQTTNLPTLVSNYFDWIRGGTGNDTIVGGSFSSIPFEPAEGQPVETFVGVNGGQVGGDGGNALWGQEGNDDIWGGMGDDVIGGGEGDDAINPLGGQDTVFGGPGNDTIHKLSGAALIYGGVGNDSIVGAEGDDTIWGGAGNDTINGDGDYTGGRDTFLFAADHGQDVIETFSVSDDALDFSSLSIRFASVADVVNASEQVASPNSNYAFALLIQTSATDSVLLLTNTEINPIELILIL